MKLNVALVTYNHEEHIREALESILSQETDFAFDIIVADDCSSDATVEIIHEYAQQSSISFRFLESTCNLGITKNYERLFRACDAQYVAIMEGDDIWTSPRRLQKHVDFLDQHYECAMSFNRMIIANYEKAIFTEFPSIEVAGHYLLLTAQDLAKDNFIGNFSACVYRAKALKALPKEMFALTAYDWLTNILVGTHGMLGLLNEVMSIYRQHTGGSWSGKSEEEKLHEMLVYIDQYDQLTKGIFHLSFGQYKNRIEAILSDMAQPVLGDTTAAVKGRQNRSWVDILKSYCPPVLALLVKSLVPPVIRERLYK